VKFPFTVGRIEHGFLARPDLCQQRCQTNPREFLGKFWVDSLVHDEHALDLLVKVCLFSFFFHFFFISDRKM
jgi:aminocarboxymuconate-semialdehyde decarboxylase